MVHLNSAKLLFGAWIYNSQKANSALVSFLRQPFGTCFDKRLSALRNFRKLGIKITEGSK
jgi:hypothetical protein